MVHVIKATSELEERVKTIWRRFGEACLITVLITAVCVHIHAPLAAYALPACLLTIAIAILSAQASLFHGYRGERRVFRHLKRLSDDYYLFNDLTIITQSGTSQIDHVLVSPYGVWCIETKARRGTIHGQEDEQQWTQVKRSDAGRKYKQRFYNPVRQNATHCHRLRDYLGRQLHQQVPVRSLVVFTSGKLKVTTDTSVVRLNNAVKTIRAADTQPCLEEKVMQRIIAALPQ